MANYPKSIPGVTNYAGVLSNRNKQNVIASTSPFTGELVPVTGIEAIGFVGGVNLYWDTSENVVASYEIWFNTINQLSNAILLDQIQANHYSLAGLTTGVNYWFWVRAVDQYGNYGPFSNVVTGDILSNTLLGIYATANGSLTASIDWVTVEIWYLLAGITNDSGALYFTTTVTQDASGTVSWTNPDYARVADDNYATVDMVALDQTNTLKFTLADLNIPSNAIVIGVQVSVGGNTTDLANENLFADILFTTNLGLIKPLNPPSVAAGSLTQCVVVSSDSTSVYATNAGDNTISMYSRNVGTGVLTPLSPPTIATGNSPQCNTVSNDGISFYAVNQNDNTMSQYSRDTGTGLLTPLSPATVATGNTPFGMIQPFDGLNVYVVNAIDNTVSQYSRDTGTGLLTPLLPFTVNCGANPAYVTSSHDGKSVYVANTNDNTISMYSRNLSTGQLTPLVIPTISTGVSPVWLTMSADDLTIYVVNNGDSTVSMFNRNTSTGTLSTLGFVNTVHLGGDIGMALCVSPDGNSLYVAERTSNTVLEFIRGVPTVPVQFPNYTASYLDQILTYGNSTDLSLFASTGVVGTPSNTTSNASALVSETTIVNVSNATAPTAGQVLTATSGTAATWQTATATPSTADILELNQIADSSYTIGSVGDSIVWASNPSPAYIASNVTITVPNNTTWTVNPYSDFDRADQTAITAVTGIVPNGCAFAVPNGNTWSVNLPIPTGALINFTIFTASNAAWSPHKNTNTIIVQVISGGGAGGGGTTGISGWGGAKGLSGWGICATVSGTYAITVGNGGTGVAGATGNNGGTSSFIGTGINLSRVGGLGGTADDTVMNAVPANNLRNGEDFEGVGGVATSQSPAGSAAANSAAGGGACYGGASAGATGGNGGSGKVYVWEYA